eukprot:TRINITY_DN287_c0_g3_i1.p1 TRINITY_DN287_c0_g3~~TRINITY_DN287_c0_g3_i1.p1  ORF type:complete len:297 (+),score=74.62 TRINITY_DN287_c0_g3_i1:418-1308(+)
MAEVPLIAVLPSWLVRQKLLNPMLIQTGGTILAARLASIYGWAINLGGGYHHCSACEGGGFCIYADISLTIKFYQTFFQAKTGRRPKTLIVDLDAHQGNGHERDFGDDDDVVIMDVFNGQIYPGDYEAKQGIKIMKQVNSGIADDQYLSIVQDGLNEAYTVWGNSNGYDLVIYNAGTDCLEGDPLGRMNVSPAGIVKRDELVWNAAISRNNPIVMVLSGGYQKTNAKIIADSIENLVGKFTLLSGQKQDRVVSKTSDSKNKSTSNNDESWLQEGEEEEEMEQDHDSKEKGKEKMNL